MSFSDGGDGTIFVAPYTAHYIANFVGQRDPDVIFNGKYQGVGCEYGTLGYKDGIHVFNRYAMASC